MNDKIELVKLLAELEACLVSVEESHLTEVERSIADIRRICQAGYKLMDNVYQKLGYK